MSDRSEGSSRVSRGELAMYGELAYVVRQISTAYVALAEGREAITDRLEKYYEEMHLPVTEDHSFGTAPEGAVRNEWEESFTLIADAEVVLQQALFGVTEKALMLQTSAKSLQSSTDSDPPREVYEGDEETPYFTDRERRISQYEAFMRN